VRRFLWRVAIHVFYAARNLWPIVAEIAVRVVIGAWIINRIVREAEKRREPDHEAPLHEVKSV
jgi:hypothetical protein